MSASLHRFLRTFLSAYRSQRTSVVVDRSGAALQCLAAFHRWGLISHCSDLDRRHHGHRPTEGTPRDPRHLTVWFHQWPIAAATANEQRGSVVGRSPHVPSGRGGHRLELVYRPTRSQRLFRSHRWLRGRLAHFNTLYLLRTSRGILTSDEALRYRLGGTLLLILHL